MVFIQDFASFWVGRDLWDAKCEHSLDQLYCMWIILPIWILIRAVKIMWVGLGFIFCYSALKCLYNNLNFVIRVLNRGC